MHKEVAADGHHAVSRGEPFAELCVAGEKVAVSGVEFFDEKLVFVLCVEYIVVEHYDVVVAEKIVGTAAGIFCFFLQLV